ncbi:MAG: nucleotide pyrophosphohydrolase [Firmicutes bacterium]|nr:nucleotide pyrophosphohydrolase [Bacillota bacterium]
METYENLVKKLSEKQSLKEIQKLREKMWRAQGFDDETPEQTMLLLVEEIGELAKALRKQIGMCCDESRNNYTKTSEEAADVFTLLLDLCTILNIDLFDALKDKSIKHIGRTWTKAKPKNN